MTKEELARKIELGMQFFFPKRSPKYYAAGCLIWLGILAAILIFRFIAEIRFDAMQRELKQKPVQQAQEAN